MSGDGFVGFCRLMVARVNESAGHVDFRHTLLNARRLFKAYECELNAV